MSKLIKQQLIYLSIVIVVAGFLIITFRDGGLLDRMRVRIQSELLTENATLESKIKELGTQIAQLTQQNRHLKKALVGRTFRFSILEQTGPAIDEDGARNLKGPDKDLSAESMYTADLSGSAGRKRTLGYLSAKPISVHSGGNFRTDHCRK